ncbi:hypothetical protein [Clostridium sp. YIM B02555]|nr:hypothetical protein [Clostridium sp. YIM B02555]
MNLNEKAVELYDPLGFKRSYIYLYGVKNISIMLNDILVNYVIIYLYW